MSSICDVDRLLGLYQIGKVDFSSEELGVIFAELLRLREMFPRFPNVEEFVRRVLGDERYDNSPCQAHPLQIVENEIERLRNEVKAKRKIKGTHAGNVLDTILQKVELIERLDWSDDGMTEAQILAGDIKRLIKNHLLVYLNS